MKQNQIKKIGAELGEAVKGVASKFGIASSAMSATLQNGCLVIKLDLAKLQEQQPTLNAIHRYKSMRAKLGLPTLGVMLMVAGKEYALLGLSSDGARVKARQNVPGAPVTDIPLAAIKSALAMDGAKKVAALDAAEAAKPADAIDPATVSLLASIGKKDVPKPAEGQK